MTVTETATATALGWGARARAERRARSGSETAPALAATGSARPLEVADLRVTYDAGRGGSPAVSLPSLVVGPGECVAIVGESGSGKTTVLNAVLGLLPESASVSGRASLFGIDATTAGRPQLASVLGRRVGLIMQNPVAALNPVMTLGTYLRHVHQWEGGRRLFGVTRRWTGGGASDQRGTGVDAAASLAQVGLDPSILTRYPHQISGGQAQRFSIALVLSLGVELIVADEPTSALDMIHQAEITQLLADLRDRSGLSLLVVSHDLAMVSQLADRIVILQRGEVLEEGATREILRTSTQPYTRELIAAVPRLRASAASAEVTDRA